MIGQRQHSRQIALAHHLDDARGKRWIDGIAGLWVVNAGHGRREIGEAMAAW